jgi:hypothetical protein
MSRKIAAQLVFATILSAACLLAGRSTASATGGPLHCPNTGGPAAISACRSWCLAQCSTRTCYGDCLDLNCTCP